MGGPADTHGSEWTARMRESRPWLQRAHAWRERIRRNPATRIAWKVVTGLVGTAVLVTGLFLVPLPGPGWLIVILGLAILASEFTWAQRILHWVRDKVLSWTHWIAARSLPVRIAVGIATALFVGLVLYAMAVVVGVPGLSPSRCTGSCPACSVPRLPGAPSCGCDATANGLVRPPPGSLRSAGPEHHGGAVPGD